MMIEGWYRLVGVDGIGTQEAHRWLVAFRPMEEIIVAPQHPIRFQVEGWRRKDWPYKRVTVGIYRGEASIPIWEITVPRGQLLQRPAPVLRPFSDGAFGKESSPALGPIPTAGGGAL